MAIYRKRWSMGKTILKETINPGALQYRMDTQPDNGAISLWQKKSCDMVGVILTPTILDNGYKLRSLWHRRPQIPNFLRATDRIWQQILILIVVGSHHHFL